MKKILFKINCILVCLLMTVGICGCDAKEVVLTTSFGKTELMRINDDSTYLPEMMLYLTNIQNAYEKVYGEDIWLQTPEGESLEAKVKDMVLAKVAQVKVMKLMAKDYNLSLSDSEEEEADAKATAYFATLNAKERELIGVTEDDVCAIYEEYALADKVYEYVIKDINPEISDDEARTITVLHILIKVYTEDASGNKTPFSKRAAEEALEKAKMILELVKSDEEAFESMSVKYSDDDEITYTFSRGEMPKEIEKAAFSLDKDEISDIIETESGYHIFKCISDFDVEKTQENKVEILKKRKEEVFDNTYEEFIKNLDKTLNEKLFDSITMIHDPEVTTTGLLDFDI